MHNCLDSQVKRSESQDYAATDWGGPGGKGKSTSFFVAGSAFASLMLLARYVSQTL
jgi:hypothetical protein